MQYLCLLHVNESGWGQLTPEQQRKEIAVWQVMPSVPEVRTGRIAIITDPRTVVPGPRVAEGTELIARTLHPEAFGR